MKSTEIDEINRPLMLSTEMDDTNKNRWNESK